MDLRNGSRMRYRRWPSICPLVGHPCGNRPECRLTFERIRHESTGSDEADVTDNPDGDLEYDFDDGFDIWTGSDTPDLASENLTPPPIGLEDDLPLLTFNPTKVAGKYPLLWPSAFGDAAGTTAQDDFRRNLKRLVSSTTKTWNFRRLTAPDGSSGWYSPFDLRKLAVAAPAQAVPQLDELFSWMRAGNVLGTDSRRAQYLANLYEYLRRGGGPLYEPIVYRGMIGFTRQPYLTALIREGDKGGALPKGRTRDFDGRFGVKIYNPGGDPLSLAPYILRFRSVVPPGSLLTAGAVLMPALDVPLNDPQLADMSAFQSLFLATDNVAGQGVSFKLPADVLKVGPRVLVELVRNIPGVGEVVFDRIDTSKPTLNGEPFVWPDWDVTDPVLVAVANNGWTNDTGGSVQVSMGARTGMIRPQGDPFSALPQFPAHMTNEFLGQGKWTRNASNLGARGQPYGDVTATNESQVFGAFGPPAVDNTGRPFIFGFPIPLPKRGGIVNPGELGRVLIVGNTVARPITDVFAEASAKARTENFGPSARWAWLNGERSLRFDFYDPAPDPAGKPYANMRMLDWVSAYATASGKDGPFAPVKFGGLAGTDPMPDDTDDDAIDTNGDDRFLPAYREGLINVNTAPRLVLRNLVWPRALRTGNRVTAGKNFDFAEAMYNHVTVQGNAFENLSDVFLWTKSVDPAVSASAWDQFLFDATDLNDYDSPLEQAYPSFEPNQAPYSAAPAWLVHFRNSGYINDMAERDALWAGNSNVLTTRSDVFTVYILVKVVRTTAAGTEDFGESRMCAVLDRTNCDPVGSAGSRHPVLPRVLARQFVE